jgi:hypothetical protein
MNGATGDPKAVRAEFAPAAQFVLQQRIRNLPSNRVFETGWLRRVATTAARSRRRNRAPNGV